MCKCLDKVQADLNKNLADELNQPTRFPTAHSNKKSENSNKAQNSVKPPKKPNGLGF